MNWIRIATKMKNDPRLGVLASHCRVRVHEAVGLVACTLMEFPDHARDGDISAVPDVVLEQWAMWTGRSGLFAQAFRQLMCDETGVVRAWEKHNGAALRKVELDIARKRAGRQNGAKTARAVLAPSAETAPERRAMSGVDETRRDVTTSPKKTGEVVSARTPYAAPAAASADQPAGQPTGSRVHYADQLDQLRAAGLPHEQAALDALIRSHPQPDVLVLELHAIASGLHLIRGQHSGRAADVADVMRAVAEMAVSAKPFSVSLFRGFVRRVADRPPEPPSAEERDAKRLERELQSQAIHVETPRSADEIEALRTQREAAMAMFRAEFGKYHHAAAA